MRAVISGLESVENSLFARRVDLKDGAPFVSAAPAVGRPVELAIERCQLGIRGSAVATIFERAQLASSAANRNGAALRTLELLPARGNDAAVQTACRQAAAETCVLDFDAAIDDDVQAACICECDGVVVDDA